MFNTFVIVYSKVNKEKMLFDHDVQCLRFLLKKTDSPDSRLGNS